MRVGNNFEERNNITNIFYAITLDDIPVYVGYTTKTIEWRFKDHLHSKDFGDIKPKIREIGRLDVPISWDKSIIEKSSKLVSDEEARYVEYYNTQGSSYQKYLGGGVVWTNIKFMARKAYSRWSHIPIITAIEIMEEAGLARKRLNSLINLTENNTRLMNVIRHTTINLSDRFLKVNNNMQISELINGTTYTTKLGGTIGQTVHGKRIKDLIKNTEPVRLQDIITLTTNQKSIASTISRTIGEKTHLRGVVNKTMSGRRIRHVVDMTRANTRLKNIISRT